MGKKDGMLISVVLDRSGSMSGLINSVIEHFNNYKEEVSHLPKVIMSIYQFDTSYEMIVENRPINEVPDLTNKTYFARGGTALLDAIGRTITQVDAIKDKPAKVVIVINTDGEENSSREYKIEQIKEMVTERQNNHDWQFVFVGAGIDAFTVSASYGFNMVATTSVPNTNAGYFNSYSTLTGATKSYSSGATASMDMSGINDPIPVEIPSVDDTKVEDTVKPKARKKKETSDQSS